ncbi:hypothetical protein Dimus_016282 [Dionaea muscipula]
MRLKIHSNDSQSLLSIADGVPVQDFQVQIDCKCEGWKRKVMEIVKEMIGIIEKIVIDERQGRVKIVVRIDTEMDRRCLEELNIERKVTIIDPKKVDNIAVSEPQQQNKGEASTISSSEGTAGDKNNPAQEVAFGADIAVSEPQQQNKLAEASTVSSSEGTAGDKNNPAQEVAFGADIAVSEPQQQNKLVEASTVSSSEGTAGDKNNPAQAVAFGADIGPQPSEIKEASTSREVNEGDPLAGIRTGLFDEENAPANDTSKQEAADGNTPNQKPLTKRIDGRAWHFCMMFIVFILKIISTVAFLGSKGFSSLEKMTQMLVEHAERLQ